MASQLGTKAIAVKDSAGAMARTAVDKLGAVKTGAGGALCSVASTVRTTGRSSAKNIDRFSSRAADRLDAVGCFVKKYRLKNLSASVRRTVRDYPTGSLVVATALGFLAASALRPNQR